MRSADQRFPMAPYHALFAVTHRNESRTGHGKSRTHKVLILRGKSAAFLSNVIGGRMPSGLPKPDSFKYSRGLLPSQVDKDWDANEIVAPASVSYPNSDIGFRIPRFRFGQVRTRDAVESTRTLQGACGCDTGRGGSPRLQSHGRKSCFPTLTAELGGCGNDRNDTNVARALASDCLVDLGGLGWRDRADALALAWIAAIVWVP
jgi:hypothetical protein